MESTPILDEHVLDEHASGQMERDWMGYRWTAWMPLMAAHPLALAQLPSVPGLYRVRKSGERHRLEWAGWEPRGVRQIIERLARQIHLPVAPYDDPSVPATILWMIRQQDGASFEVSGAPLDLDNAEGEESARALLRALGEQRTGFHGEVQQGTPLLSDYNGRRLL